MPKSNSARDFSRIVLRVNADISKRENRVGWEALTDAERIFTYVFVFDAQVCNGGFGQFFFGSVAGDNARETLMGLSKVGAKESHELLLRCMKHFPNESPSRNLDERIMVCRSWGKDCPIDAYDTLYYEKRERMDELLANYASKNISRSRK